MTTLSTKQNKLNLDLKNLIVPVVVMVAFWFLAIIMWQSSGYLQALFFFGYIGSSVGIGLGLYAALPKKRKLLGRRISLFMVGAFLFYYAVFLGFENMQISGFFFGLITGVIQGSVVHYFIAKILGPILFGRLWCGWACWTVMILDLLPYKRSKGRLPGNWGWLRYLNFILILSLVLFLIYRVGFIEGSAGTPAVAWFIIGNLIYYIIGVGVAFVLRDNRAFCKYVCPVTVPLKLTSRFSMLKIRGTASKCNDCRTCTTLCPMDINIPKYHQMDQRVLSTECSLCQTCITVCHQDALKLSFGFDLGGKELLRVRK